MGRLILAVVAAAAACAPTLSFAAQPRAAIEGDLDPSLRAAIVSEIGETDRPIDNRFEARRRARDAAETATAVLRSEGYYAAIVEPEVGDGDTPTPKVRITPGPRFTITAPAIEWVGTAPPAQDEAAAQKALALSPGAPGRAAEVVGAEGRIVSTLEQKGYADAEAEPRQVVVDHADRSVQPTFHIAAGPLVRLDGIQLTNTGRTNPRWVEGLAPWKPGDVYDPELVAELQRRLLDPGAYDQVTVALAPVDKTTTEGLRPVLVGLAERKRRTFEFGASYASVEGLGLDVRWTRYNTFRRADTFALFGRLSTVDSRVGVTVGLPHWRRPAQTLTLGAEAYHANTDAYDQTGVTARSDVQRRYGKTSYVSVGASTDFSRTNELRIGSLTPLGREIATFALHGNVYLDRSNDALDPRRGWRLNLIADPTLLAGHGTLPYLRVQTQGTGYLPIGRGARTVLAGRLRIGSILNGTVSDIPAPQRFYAGGGGSVRGFSYQAVGPRLADDNDTPEGGLSLIEASTEIRQMVTARWGVVAFVDAGSISITRNPDFSNLSVGAGLGLRYNLPFGPIRVDVATPVSNAQGGSPVQIYVSIGQSF
ncbi:autotransporter assembly complex protein TamA [Phenylobacterium sp. LjRoot225]|uniref:autotransporter assembly complex protein TamA n=1 Tax=Phenylobacterium sp. LjRoot225 TaxID=3342285 RepID=UPI003ECFCEEA